MKICYEYVGIARWYDTLSLDAQATWTGVFVAIAAAVVPAIFWFVDRWRDQDVRKREADNRKRELKLAQEQAETQRKNSVVRQIIMCLPALRETKQRMSKVRRMLGREPRELDSIDRINLTVPDLERMATHLSDLAAFPADIDVRLMAFLSRAYQLDLVVREAFSVEPKEQGRERGYAHHHIWTLAQEPVAALDKLSGDLVVAMQAILDPQFAPSRKE